MLFVALVHWLVLLCLTQIIVVLQQKMVATERSANASIFDPPYTFGFVFSPNSTDFRMNSTHRNNATDDKHAVKL